MAYNIPPYQQPYTPMQVAMPAMQQPAVQQAHVRVKLPDNCVPGQQCDVQTPDGQTMRITVPPNFGAGGFVTMQYQPKVGASVAAQPFNAPAMQRPPYNVAPPQYQPQAPQQHSPGFQQAAQFAPQRVDFPPQQQAAQYASQQVQQAQHQEQHHAQHAQQAPPQAQHQHPQQAPQQAQNNMQTCQTTLPDNVQAGEILRVETPDGCTVEIQVPPGARAGQTITFEYAKP